MNRRDLLRQSALASAALAARRNLCAQGESSRADVHPAIKRVLVVTKCHLDVGFTDTQANVVRKYYDVYYPAAIELAAQLDPARSKPVTEAGKPSRFHQGGAEHGGGPMPSTAAVHPRYTWTTGSWLLYTYLEQATAAQRKTMEDAIRAGHIAWHALPFSWQTELLSPRMIEGGLSFSQELDRRFGTKTTGCKMTDVPGHTRGIIAPLAAAGVTLLDIGVNAASTPPEVPDVFRWQDHAGHEMTVLYHRHDYGSTLPIPGSDLAICVEVKNDNGGPHSVAEITAIYNRLHRDFPNAAIEAASFTQVANAVEPFRKHLPVVTGEIGDTWIYGVPSDPPKVARFLELSRLRDEWLNDGKLQAGGAVDRAYLQHLLLSAEHTWGTDTKSYLDYNHYRPAELAAAEAAHLPGYAKMETSWQEKRDNITAAIATLPSALQAEADTRLTALIDPPTASRGMYGPAAATAAGLVLESPDLRLRIDPESGTITSLIDRRSGRDWASPTNPLALFTYQTLSAQEFTNFIRRYIVLETDWAPKDFGKPEINCFNARAAEYQPMIGQAAAQSSEAEQSLSLELRFRGAVQRLAEAPPNQAGCPVDTGAIGGPRLTPPPNHAWPRQLTLDLILRNDSPTLDLTVTLRNKPANRLPEAMWLTFNPIAPDPKGWLLTKSGQPVLPTEVLRGGGRNMHAVTGPIRYADAHGSLALTTHDAPVVALGWRSPLNYSPDLPNLADGLHVSLFNNAWGTNYPQWASGDWQYRFSLTVG